MPEQEERPTGRARGKGCDVLVLDQGDRGKRWSVQVDGKEGARFSRLEEAVEAADWEVEQRGPRAMASALPQAS